MQESGEAMFAWLVCTICKFDCLLVQESGVAVFAWLVLPMRLSNCFIVHQSEGVMFAWLVFTYEIIKLICCARNAGRQCLHGWFVLFL